MEYKYIFFDVAQTLLYKPQLYETIHQSLLQFDIKINKRFIEETHTLIASVLTTPSKTSKEFYDGFNAELLYVCGIIPRKELLDTIYNNCRNLPWQAFEDTKNLSEINPPKGIISNWDDSLEEKITKIFPGLFSPVISSARIGFSKPDKKLFAHALSVSNLSPESAIYVGDSIKLDIEPALKVGLRAILIDRNNRYPYFRGEKINSLNELSKLLQDMQHEN